MDPPICSHCGRRNVFDEAAVIATEADGDYTCRACGHHWRPRKSLAYLATETLIRKLADEKESS